jgi:opacity protein-like surface antigen
MTVSTAFSSLASARGDSRAVKSRALKSRALKSLGLAGLLLALCLLAAAPASAQNQYQLAVLGGVGGALDGDPLSHPALELQFGYPRGVRDLVVFRLGRINLSADDDLFVVDGELSWLTLTSEYRLPDDYYISGIFVGLGYYQRRSDNGFGDDEGVGATLGVDGEFALTEHWGVLLQLTGHWANLSRDQVWTTAMGGLTFSF